MFRGSSACSKDREEERSAARAVSSSENACKGFPHSKLCEIFEWRREEKADIWIKSCWALSAFETEDLAANKVNRSVAYLFGWISRPNESLVQEADWLLREEWGWKNICFTEDAFTGALPFCWLFPNSFFLSSVCKAHLHLGASNMLSKGHFLRKCQGRGVHYSLEIGP